MFPTLFAGNATTPATAAASPPEWGVSQTGNIGNAIIIAREKGFVTFSDVMESINKYFDFPWVGACGYNTGSNKARALLSRHHDGPMAALQLERHQEGHQPGQSLRRRPCAGWEG